MGEGRQPVSLADISLSLGAIVKPIGEQLEAQGVKLDAETLRRLQLKADALSVVSVHSLVVPSAVERGRIKLMKEIGTDVRAAISRAEAQS